MARLRIIRDRDGDGIRDYIEKQRWRMVKGDGSTFTLDPFPDEVVRTPVGLAIAAGSADVLVASYELADARGTTTRNELVTATAATYEDTAVGDVTLPVGASVTASSALVGETSRGYGWEYISSTTTITQDELGYILTNSPEVYQRGDRRVVIGNNRAGEERVLDIIGGTLVAAGAGATVNDPCEEIANVEKHGEHATREEKPIDDVSTLRELIRNEVVKIVEASGQRYYVAQIGVNEFTLIVAQGGPGYWIVRTTLVSKTAQDLFKSVEQAIKEGIDAPEDAQEVIYDPENDIDC